MNKHLAIKLPNLGRHLGAALLAFGLCVQAQAQRLIYEWNFTNNVTGTLTNMAPVYVGTNQQGIILASLPGQGNLNVINLKGTGAGINAYFTNGPGVGPGIVGTPAPGHPEYGSSSASGAYVVQGQGYGNNGLPVAQAQGTNLNLGVMYRFTLTFWFQLGATMGNRFPRLVMVGNNTNYDEASAGVYGFASSLNSWTTSVTPNVAKSMQNDLSGTSQANGVTPNLPANFANATGVNGIVCDASTWYFCAEEYNGSTNAGQWTSWLGTSTTNVVKIDSQNLAFLGIPFGITNTTIQIGGSYTGLRSITDGQIADVRFYAGNVNSNNLEVLRTLNLPNWVDDHSGDPVSAPFISGQPISGSTFAGGTRTFTVDAQALAPVAYQWKSNGIPILGATNVTLTGSYLTLTNIPLSANQSLISCTITNRLGATNSAGAFLSVLSAAPGSYDYAVLTNLPYIYWRLNETTNLDGSAVNLSDYINGLDGTVVYPTNDLFQVGGLDAPIYPGFAATNGGVETIAGGRPSDITMVPLANFTNGMTICGWILTPTLPGSHAIIYSMLNNNLGAGTTSSGYGLTFNSSGTDANGNQGGQLGYNWNGTALGSTSFASGLIVPTNEWTFVALTIDPTGEFATLYKGSPGTGLQSSIDDTNVTGDVILDTAGFAPSIVLGRSDYGYWSGTSYGANTMAFSDVAIFYSALPASTITNLYVIGAGVPRPRLTGVADPATPGNLLLNWNFGTLQESTPGVTGPYTDVPSLPIPPYSIPMTDAQHYFRVRN